MKIKNLVRLTEQHPLDLKTFHHLATQHNLSFEKISKFLIRLNNLRQRNTL